MSTVVRPHPFIISGRARGCFSNFTELCSLSLYGEVSALHAIGPMALNKPHSSFECALHWTRSISFQMASANCVACTLLLYARHSASVCLVICSLVSWLRERPCFCALFVFVCGRQLLARGPLHTAAQHSVIFPRAIFRSERVLSCSLRHIAYRTAWTLWAVATTTGQCPLPAPL